MSIQVTFRGKRMGDLIFSHLSKFSPMCAHVDRPNSSRQEQWKGTWGWCPEAPASWAQLAPLSPTG